MAGASRQKNVLCIRFEDLINNRDATLNVNA